ncbi:hypothetical protein [Pseudoroseomonas cervicalis]|uniref:hypothetical protein n=1 Tax=Teichococcus cervicalis TaxID=204525 RepID=UPI0022F18201|nr:hypothetical protein [Pseudoroseomonas cervicalis]WBV42524.1 hypothetical protein PFY06_14940 [Pseudoroseomonas cervicalis]
MRLIHNLPQQSFPLATEALARMNEPGLLGDVGRSLNHGVVTWVSLKPEAALAVERLQTAPKHFLLSIVAGLEPFGTAWVEYTDSTGTRRGFLGGAYDDGSIWVRLIRSERETPAYCKPVSLTRRGAALRVTSGWSAVLAGDWHPDPAADERWLQWAEQNIQLELVDPALAVEQSFEVPDGTSILELVVLASAMSRGSGHSLPTTNSNRVT